MTAPRIEDVIKLLPERSPSPSWFHDEELIAKAMEAFKVSTSATIIEVGSWMGDSSAWFAGRVPSGTVYCVDSWAGPIDNDQYRLSNIYQQFLSNMKHRGLTNVTPVRMKSIEAAMSLELMADMIYIDADHSAVGAFEDIMMWSTHMKSGGLLCGDDYSWYTVQDAVHRAAEMLGKRVCHGPEFWYFQSNMANNDTVV
jgi:predicted O-methyltransferase YrrM